MLYRVIESHPHTQRIRESPNARNAQCLRVSPSPKQLLEISRIKNGIQTPEESEKFLKKEEVFSLQQPFYLFQDPRPNRFFL